jgi:tripartite-type tricarboxylate transporter receptor subunit TctC
VKTLAEYIALARQKPGQLTYASTGAGSASHLAGEMFRTMAGIEVLHVPYKGSTAALPDLAAGRVDFMIVSAPEALPFIRDGRLHALGSSSTKRAASLPDVPTIAEAGLKGYAVTAWAMLVVPAGTPPAVIQRLNREFNVAVSDADVRRRLEALSVEPGGGTPAEAAEFLQQQSQEWGQLIRARGIKAG